MTATETLRALLDERGVEWWQSANVLGCIFTRWHSPLFGDEVVAMENGKEGLVLFDHFMTPQQAVDATLGRGECHEEEDEDTGFICCSECGAVLPEDYTVYYCWNCGRKVVVARPPTRSRACWTWNSPSCCRVRGVVEPRC